MLILAGSKSKVLGQKVARTLGVAPVEYESKRFPDSSFYAKLMDPASVKGQEIAIIQSCIRDEDIIELLVLQEMVKENGARGIITIVPYFGGYARQDKVFQPGEPVSARALAKLFQIYSDQVITVDVHSELVSRFFENKMINLSPAEPVAEYLKKHDVNWVIAQDAGARSRRSWVFKLIISRKNE
jgi:ribose-phosphate pyrophosphokinase